jgi:hypothetical protein
VYVNNNFHVNKHLPPLSHRNSRSLKDQVFEHSSTGICTRGGGGEEEEEKEEEEEEEEDLFIHEHRHLSVQHNTSVVSA